MSDDIVTRLREAERLVRDSQMDCDDTGDLIDWCADEIERLRADLKHLLQLWEVFIVAVQEEQFGDLKWIRGEMSSEELNVLATGRSRAFKAFDEAVRGDNIRTA